VDNTEPPDLVLITQDKSIITFAFLAVICSIAGVVAFVETFRRDYGAVRSCLIVILSLGGIVFMGVRKRVFAQELRLSRTNLTANFFNKVVVIPLSEISKLENHNDSEGAYSTIQLTNGRFIYIPSPVVAKEMFEAVSTLTGVPISQRKRWFDSWGQRK
jgi:hypothetical protein